MPSERPARRLLDIIENGQAVLHYTAGLDAASFRESKIVCDAVERCLERISEAAAKLGDLGPSLIPDLPWRDIRALGNRLRHNYDEISRDRLWEIVENDIPKLMAGCESALRKWRESRESEK